MMRRMPSVFGGALFGSALLAVGLRELRQLETAWPSGVRIIAMSAPSSPMTEFLEESDRICEAACLTTNRSAPQCALSFFSESDKKRHVRWFHRAAAAPLLPCACHRAVQAGCIISRAYPSPIP
jgi:hypothetical protein